MHPTGMHFKNKILESNFVRKKNKTRMYSRMRTVSGKGEGCLPEGVICLGGGVGWDVCLEGCLPRGCLSAGYLPSPTQRQTPPVDRQTPVKTLPLRNYCCGR